MAMPMSEYELEALPEMEEEYEGEWEGDFESEEFFRRLAGWAQQQWGTRGSPLRRVALGASRAALTTGGGVGDPCWGWARGGHGSRGGGWRRCWRSLA